ncbi:zinc finger protein 808-like isoform X1 [Patiria miniata]|uniref:C2H2-type domain-containing protein n=1 Tax=Patiria miniata TaxID=46514 RepID=A0A914AG09_PATMI|nr:zinc finger protein 808-like isoform X1 [Patiria miniata]
MDRSEKSSTSTTMSSLTQSDKYALAFQLVTQLTSLVDGVLFAKRMAVLQVIKEAWEKNTEVTVITEESSFDCGEQMNPDTAERMQSPQMAPVDSNLGSIEENPATFQALDVVVKQEVEHPGMPRIEQVVGYGLHPMGVAGYTDRALSSVDESGSSVTGSPEAENTRDLDQSPNTRPDFDQTSECPRGRLDTEDLFEDLGNNRAQVTVKKMSLDGTVQLGNGDQSPREDNGFDAYQDNSHVRKSFEDDENDEEEDSGDETDTGDVSTPQSVGKTRPFECKYCKRSFKFGEFSAGRPFHCPHCQHNASPREQGRLRSSPSSIDTPIGLSPKTSTPAVSPRKFPCPLCPKRFLRKGHLREHLWTHSKDKKISCAFCSKTCRTVKESRLHAKTHLNQNISNSNLNQLQSNRTTISPKPQSEAPHPMHLTRVSYSAEEETVAHASSNSPTSPGVNQWYRCDICEVDFPAETALAEHMKGHIAFPTRVDLQQHQRVHTGKGPTGRVRLEASRPTRASKSIRKKYERLRKHNDGFKCNLCYKVLFTVKGFQKHQENHTCKICFKTIKKLGAHMRVHSNMRPHQCPECLDLFKARKYLLKHWVSVHGKELLKCRACVRVFLDSDSLSHHEQEHHQLVEDKSCEEADPEVRSKETSHQCTKCRKLFSTNGNLRRHMIEVCSKSLVSEKMPVLTAAHCCPYCPKMFAYQNNLEKHMQIHTNKKPHVGRRFDCSTCQEVFATKAALIKHRQMQHKPTATGILDGKDSSAVDESLEQDESNHIDAGGVANKASPSSGSSKTHRSGIKPKYRCRYCNVNLSSKVRLLHHESLHIKNPSMIRKLGKYCCKYCNVNLSSKIRLLHHESLHIKNPSMIRKMGKKMPGRLTSPRQMHKKKVPKRMPASPIRKLGNTSSTQKGSKTSPKMASTGQISKVPKAKKNLSPRVACASTSQFQFANAPKSHTPNVTSLRSPSRPAAKQKSPNMSDCRSPSVHLPSTRPLHKMPKKSPIRKLGNTSSIQKGSITSPKMAGTGQISKVAKAKKNLSPRLAGASTSQFQFANAPKSHSQLVTSLGSPMRQTAQQKSPRMIDRRSPSKQGSITFELDNNPIIHQAYSKVFTSAEKRALHDQSHITHSSESKNAPSVSGTSIKQEKLYQCGFCNKVCKQRYLLTRHERQHTGEKPYSCTCGKAFPSVGSLRKHQKFHCTQKGQSDSMPANF